MRKFASFQFIIQLIQFNNMQEVNNYIGIWKFNNKVSLQEIEELAKEWAKDEKYLSLHIRQCSQNQNGLSFEYHDTTGNETDGAFTEFIDRVSDSLRRKFGNGLAGWDTSRMYYKVK